MAIDDEGVIKKLMKPPEGRWTSLLLASTGFPSGEASGATEIATMVWFDVIRDSSGIAWIDSDLNLRHVWAGGSEVH